MKSKTAVTLLCILAVPVVAGAAQPMREGLWEIQSQVEMPGMPVKMQPTVIKHCYSKDEVKDQKKVIARDKNCTVTDLKTSGNRVSWSMKCTGEQAATMTGETVFAGDSYNSVMQMKSAGHSMTTRIKAKRVGNCP